jgi:hypothetical protein
MGVAKPPPNSQMKVAETTLVPWPSEHIWGWLNHPMAIEIRGWFNQLKWRTIYI